MKFEIGGELFPPKGKEKYWSVEMKALGIHTQGTSKRDAYEMARDAIETMFDGEIEVEVVGGEGYYFIVQLDLNDKIFSLLLRHIREAHEMTVMEVSKKLGSNSPNSYGRYEQGKSSPSMEKFAQILSAFDLEPVLKIGNG